MQKENKETLEEAIEKYVETYRCPATNDNEYCKHDIISAINFGFKLAQGRMYSEEELKQAINLAFVFSGGMSENETYQDCELFCLEQFKKK